MVLAPTLRFSANQLVPSLQTANTAPIFSLLVWAAMESASAFNVGQNVIVKKCWQRDGSCLWAVQRFDEVLANDGIGWNYELQPSDRDEAFMARYRFATMELAMTAARAALATVEGVGK